MASTPLRLVFAACLALSFSAAQAEDPGKIAVQVEELDRHRIVAAADAAMKTKPVTITSFRAKHGEGGPNDYYSNGDYWWPDPSKEDGLPYIRRDGETNPENFDKHRQVVRQMRDNVAALAAAYRITHDEAYVAKATDFLDTFFLDGKTRMNPNLNHAQAIPGISPGRGIGIIDTLHLIEVPLAIEALAASKAFPDEKKRQLQAWFGDYMKWILTSKNGKDEAATQNNHAVCYWLQIAVFARFTGDGSLLAECRRRFMEDFIGGQMAPDGSFPRELARTKPYGYSLFQLDNMATLCHLLSDGTISLWSYEDSEGRGMRRAVGYLYPYIADKSSWPREPDIQSWEGWPTRQAALLFSAIAYQEPRYLNLWRELKPDPEIEEVRRNVAITQPILWIRE